LRARLRADFQVQRRTATHHQHAIEKCTNAFHEDGASSSHLTKKPVGSDSASPPRARMTSQICFRSSGVSATGLYPWARHTV
jgi:hypothetical protein